MNTSATGGYLTPTSPVPASDLDLDIVFQNHIGWLAGLSSDLVRPRWQPEPATAPTSDNTWIAIGATALDDDEYPVQSFVSDAVGSVLIRHETIDVLCSFYGPRAGQALRTVRDGLLINQNSEAINALGIFYKGKSRSTRVPSLVKTLWLNRIDTTFQFRRQIEEAYPILSVTSAPGSIGTDTTNLPTGLQFPLKPN